MVSLNSVFDPKSSTVYVFFYHLLLVTIITLTSPNVCVAKQFDEKANNIEQHKMVARFQEMAAIPGISFASNNKQNIVTSVALGYANTDTKKIVDGRTIFQAASLSKPVLAYIVLQMVQRDEISLDTPLFEIVENERITNKDWAKLITPRLVLSHQTGLPNWGGDQLTLNFKPGTSYNYSGEGYVYLQQTLEKITGLSYQALAEREVFKPLNMNDSYFTWSEDMALEIATGHNRSGTPSLARIPKANAAASLHTTATDYIKFIRAWFEDKHINESSRQQAFSASADTTSYRKGLPEISWGLGWGLYQQDDKNIAWHWGDNGNFRSFVAIEPASKKAFVYFTNSANGLAISKQMTEMIFPESQAIDQWLGYGQADTAIWQTEHQGYVYASRGEFSKAITKFEEVLREFPNNGRIKRKISWITPYVNSSGEVIKLTEDYMSRLSGQYDERNISFENGVLIYQRGTGTQHILTPISNDLFRVGDFTDFRIQFSFDEQNNPVKLIGLYEGGYKDESLINAN